MPTKAYSYIRFSTRAQFSGDSLNRQLNRAREYAEEHGLELDESSYQDLGISAFKGKNATDGALGAFLRAVDYGLVPPGTTLLVESLDRISRANIMDAFPLFLGIVNRGVTVVTLMDNQVYTRDHIVDNGMMLFASMIVLMRAHDESKAKSDRSKKALKRLREEGFKIGPAPFWLSKSGDGKSFRIVAGQADIVREVFHMRAQTIGSLRIAKQLNKKYGWKFGSPQVSRMLKNPAVIGIRLSQAGYDPLEGYYPTIVKQSQFFEVQTLMAASVSATRGRRHPDEACLFTGIAKCANCGAAMTFYRESSRVSQRYLHCAKSVSKAGCDSCMVNYDAFEKEVIGWLLLDQDDEWVKLLDKQTVEVVDYAAELANLRNQQSRLTDLFAAGTGSVHVVSEKLQQLQQKIDVVLKAQLQAPPDERMFAEKAWELVERHENAMLSDDKDGLIQTRREIKAALLRSVRVLDVSPEQRIGNVYHGQFTVEFRHAEGRYTRKYKRPALNNLSGTQNGKHRTKIGS